jgi:hypothetical protein
MTDPGARAHHTPLGEDTVTIGTEHARDCDGGPCKSWCPLAPCPAWCTGKHNRPDWVSAERPRYWHKSAACPPWCDGHLGFEPDCDRITHHGRGIEVELSLAPPIDVISLDGKDETRADYISAEPWQPDATTAPTVAVRHGDDYLPDMTPSEALALAVALAQAAWRVQPDAMAALEIPSPEGFTCPPWCITPHTVPDERHLDDELHLSEGHTVPTAREHHDCRARTGTCELGVSADLVYEVATGDVTVEVYHGDEVMPRLTPAGAATFALGLLAEVAGAAGTDGRNPQ